ncbi:hypothetical protein BDP27DRAFT_1399194 [Rhodocollybia butyracea]|uniref:Uncharacterized protein n=1 Tax=Rhodocollybia butyracea TaxID=206335 RepID=A0A9P5PYH0_9AGAR|nr:hypothetical protein BDP27DRAFT_1399194 [Rhodocollybia butyracea]
MSPLDCASLVGSESFAQIFHRVNIEPEILWIFASFLIFMTLLRHTLFPCVTLRGLEDTIKSVDTMLKEHMGRGMLDCNEHMLHDRRLLDHGDPQAERSQRCVDFEDRLCRQINALKQEIEHSIIVVSLKHHNRMKLDVAAFLRQQNTMQSKIVNIHKQAVSFDEKRDGMGGFARPYSIKLEIRVKRSSFENIRGTTTAPPIIQIEEGERINAFWMEFTLNNCWGVAVGTLSSPVFESHGSTTDVPYVPWPLDMAEYEQVMWNASRESGSPGSYLQSVHQGSIPMNHQSAMTVQNSFLQRVFNISSILTSSSLRPALHTNSAHCPRHAQSRLPRRHSVFVPVSPQSRRKALEAARACVMILRQVDLSGVAHVNAILGSCWPNVSSTYTLAEKDEKTGRYWTWLGIGGSSLRYAASSEDWRRASLYDIEGGSEKVSEEDVVGMLEKGFAIMTVFPMDSPLIVQEAYKTISSLGYKIFASHAVLQVQTIKTLLTTIAQSHIKIRGDLNCGLKWNAIATT